MLKARAADMAGREEMDCGMGELAEPGVWWLLRVGDSTVLGLARLADLSAVVPMLLTQPPPAYSTQHRPMFKLALLQSTCCAYRTTVLTAASLRATPIFILKDSRYPHCQVLRLSITY
jgi:hypothetical protein